MKPTDFSYPKRSYVSVAKMLAKRHAASNRFKLYGILSILFAVSLITILFITLIIKGWPAFIRTTVTLPIYKSELVKIKNQDSINDGLVYSLNSTMKQPTLEHEDLLALLSAESSRQMYKLVKQIEQAPLAFKFTASHAVDHWYKLYKLTNEQIPISNLRLSHDQVEAIESLLSQNRLHFDFNHEFFLGGDSQEPEIAGIFSALIGSIMTLTIAMCVAVPIGIASAIYLEEFAPKNRFFDLLEININNLAAIPTIIFGLLGLAFFLNILKFPRSSSLAAGLTLSLIILPIIIIASRTALKTVPQSIRYAAQGLGASVMQMVFHHALPLALPGILTGSLLGLVRAMGESAPLLMLGMVAFIVDPPQSIFDPATVLPVQIFTWAKNPSRGFIENTSAATLVLLLFLLIINAIIVFLRRKFERKW
ncbi:MAG: phosphate ABC transporter, permease protein PstA [Alphaproteobacteria bacterium 43-37]|nr:MAG: phosphate ABC transporter, permease protein PstA [Alphaproteobacteria bacterium 43-37]